MAREAEEEVREWLVIQVELTGCEWKKQSNLECGDFVEEMVITVSEAIGRSVSRQGINSTNNRAHILTRPRVLGLGQEMQINVAGYISRRCD